jgi:hypothetical protein
VGEHFDRLAAEDNRRDTATPVEAHTIKSHFLAWAASMIA